jgi:hypothetical protein
VKIRFTDTTSLIAKEFQPKLASSLIPEWYKNLDSYIGGKKGLDKQQNATLGTIKKCIPVFDAITNGYIIVLPADIYVSQELADPLNPEIKTPYYQWANFDLLNFHPVEQAPTHPNNNGHTITYPKFMNPWSIKTPKGYSVLFVQPFHRESVFTILPGIVDTDTYNSPVNFPFVLNDINFEGLIPAGTPIAQLIPIKREKWNLEFGNDKDILESNRQTKRVRSRFFDSYKNNFWNRKEYK